MAKTRYVPGQKSERLTLKSAREYVQALGMTLVNTGYDYRVSFLGDPSGHGYFTDDLEDAVRTAKAMFETRSVRLRFRGR